MSRVVVVGAGVAGLTAASRLRRSGAHVTVLEGAARIGGLVESERTEGWVVEYGADGFLIGKANMAGHVAGLGLDNKVVGGGKTPRRAYIATAKGLEPLPTSLFRFERGALLELMSSRLLSPGAKLRLLLEPFVPRGHAEESVSGFVSRRFGSEVSDHIVEPMLRGVFGSPASELGMQGAMPKLAAHEQRYGSVGVALMLAPRAGAGGGLVSLSGGMQTLVDALGRDVAPITYLSAPAQSIRRHANGGLVVTTSRHGAIVADSVVLACPAHVAARLVAGLDNDLADELALVRSADVEVVSLGYEVRDLPAIEGTGFLVDPTLGRALVACTWSSQKWRGRAPSERFLVRCVVHGPECTDEELIALTREELRHFVGITATPVLTRVRRRRNTLPVYAPGHKALVARARERASALGIELAGNAYDGIGVPDCVASGLDAALRLDQTLQKAL